MVLGCRLEPLDTQTTDSVNSSFQETDSEMFLSSSDEFLSKNKDKEDEVAASPRSSYSMEELVQRCRLVIGSHSKSKHFKKFKGQHDTGEQYTFDEQYKFEPEGVPLAALTQVYRTMGISLNSDVIVLLVFVSRFVGVLTNAAVIGWWWALIVDSFSCFFSPLPNKSPSDNSIYYIFSPSWLNLILLYHFSLEQKFSHLSSIFFCTSICAIPNIMLVHNKSLL